MSLQEIYQEVLLAHNEHPNNFFRMDKPSCQAHGNNPLCGDEISVYLELKENKIHQISFLGEGCAICRASASIMTEKLKGKAVVEAKREAQAFIDLLNDAQKPIPEDLGELAALLGVRNFPARIKCATLAWHTFIKALDGGDNATEACASNCHSCCF